MQYMESGIWFHNHPKEDLGSLELNKSPSINTLSFDLWGYFQGRAILSWICMSHETCTENTSICTYNKYPAIGLVVFGYLFERCVLF